MKRHIFSLIVLLLLSFGAIRPLLAKGFFPMHDDTQVGRVIVMGKALRNGQFPVRWVSDLGYGYGYPLFNYYGPLPYYVGGFLYALGLPAVEATKLIFLFGIILSGFTMYVLAGTWFGASAGILAAILYMYAPYHAAQAYVRGAVGELWAYAFLPLAVWGFLRMRDTAERSEALLIGGIGLAGVILSHTILGYVTIAFYVAGLVLYSLILVFKKRLDFSLLTSHFSLLLIGLGLSAFFWLPAISEMRFTNVSGQIGLTADYRDHFVCLSQLWNSPWGFGGSAKGCTDGMSYKLGKLQILTAVAAVLVWIVKRRSNQKYDRYMVFGMGVSILSIFFMLQASQVLWKFAPNARYIQYPWRLLTYAVLGISMTGGAVVVFIRNRLQRLLLVGAVCIMVVGVNAKWFLGQFIINKPAGSYESQEELRYRVSKISDEYLPPDFVRPQKPSESSYEAVPLSRQYSAETEVDTETYTKIALQSNVDTEVSLQRVYFPGWEYWVNGKKVLPNIQDSLPRIAVPAGESVLEMHFFNTPVRSLANLISIITLGSLLVVYGSKKTSETIA
ncbi:MAG: hypothetical protein AAB889_02845 [Patescibacteria group bacterium]